MANDSGIRFDMSRWKLKADKVKADLAWAVKDAVDFGMDEVNKEAARNLSGPHYGRAENWRGPATGSMPIPRLTGNLARSLKTDRPKPELGKVYSASDVASYNRLVHDGFKGGTDKKGRKYPGQKPRRFLGDAVKVKKAEVKKRWNTNIKTALRKAGR